jgi:TetR/AcrR family transcriptional regulator, transcriptional repressor for nem operon
MTDVIEADSQPSTRARIVAAATMLFWREGYHPVSTDAICRAANVKKGSLYYAFPTKAEILAASLERVWARNWAELEAIYKRSGTIEERFREHLQWFGESQSRLKAEYGLVLGTFDMALGVSIPAEVLASMREHQEVHLARIKASVAGTQGRVADESRVDRLTEIVSQLISGAMIRARLSDDLAPLEKLPTVIFEILRSSTLGDS